MHCISVHAHTKPRRRPEGTHRCRTIRNLREHSCSGKSPPTARSRRRVGQGHPRFRSRALEWVTGRLGSALDAAKALANVTHPDRSSRPKHFSHCQLADLGSQPLLGHDGATQITSNCPVASSGSISIPVSRAWRTSTCNWDYMSVITSATFVSG